MQKEMKDRLRYALDLRGKKAVDLARDLKIPKSAISQYLSGNRTIKDSKRLYIIAEYLDVSEAWLMGFDVPIEKTVTQKKNDTLTDIVVRMRTDKEFASILKGLNQLDSVQLASVKQVVEAFLSKKG